MNRKFSASVALFNGVVHFLRARPEILFSISTFKFVVPIYYKCCTLAESIIEFRYPHMGAEMLFSFHDSIEEI